MNRNLFSFGCLAVIVVSAAVACGGDSPSDETSWSKIRDQQPAALTLKLVLSKTTFYQGEAIDGALTITNTGTAPYNIFAANMIYPRNESIRFYATGADGALVRDPMDWYFKSNGYCGSQPFMHEDVVSPWKATRSINPWVCFDRPGTYSLFAVAAVQAGTAGDWLKSLQTLQVPRSGKIFSTNDTAQTWHWIDVASDPITVTVLPLPPEEEKRRIAAARQSLTAGEDEAEKGAMALRFLDTPAAREALLPLLGGPQSEIATLGICAAPDPEHEAALVLDAVRNGRLPLNGAIIRVYRSLKTSFFGLPWKEPKSAIFARYGKTLESSVNEIIAAALSATGGQGPAYYQTLLEIYLENQDLAVRAILVRDQLKLEPAQVAALFQAWQIFASPDFQPLVRQATGAPYYNATALRALLETDPAAARPLIIEDLQREVPRYASKGVHEDSVLFSLPAGPISELEPYFRQQLQTLNPDTEHEPEFLVTAVNRYGPPSLLPELIAFHQKESEVRDWEAEANVLQFWVRNDPAGGLAAMSQVLGQRQNTHWYTRVLDLVLLEQWTDAALPLLIEALNDPDPEVVISAIRVLERHAETKWMEPTLTALHRLAANKEPSGSATAALFASQRLLGSDRWKWSDLQRKELEKIRDHAREQVNQTL